MRSSKRYGRQIPETPQEVVDHALWTAHPRDRNRMRLAGWMLAELGNQEATRLWREALALDAGRVEAD